MTSFLRSLLPAALCAAALSASATDGRYREYVVGERAGGMGGAATAVARDVDAIFYNPAGMALSSGDSISLSANLYGAEHYKQKNGLGYGDDEDSSSFVSIPGAIGGVKRLADEWAAGFGVFAPKQEKRHIVSEFGGQSRFYHYDYNDQTLWFGPALSWAPADSRIALGAGIFGVYRDFSLSESTFRSGDSVNSLACDVKTLNLLATLGVQYDFGDGWSAGVALQTPTLRVWDDGVISINGVWDENGDPSSGGIYTKDVRADNYIPLQVAAGVGRTVPGVWGFALDAIYHPSAHFDFMRLDQGMFDGNASLHLHSVLDVSLGGEYVVAEKYPIRAGVYTAFSSIRVPGDPENTDLVTTDVDMYGVTFSVGRKVDENMTVNIGLDAAFGHGHDLGEDEEGYDRRTACDRRVLLATVSTTYCF